MNFLKELCDGLRGGRLRVCDDKAKRGDASHQYVKSFGVGSLIVCHRYILADEPVVTLHCHSPYKGEITRKQVAVRQSVKVLLPVEGHDRKAVACFPDKFPGKVSALQISSDLLHPLRCGDRRKLFK